MSTKEWHLYSKIARATFNLLITVHEQHTELLGSRPNPEP